MAARGTSWSPSIRRSQREQRPYQLHGEVAVITLDNPPMNGFSHALRTQIVAGVEQAEADPGVKAIVLIGSARVFSSGADIREFGTPKMLAEPTLRTAISVVESATKPVIAAIGGICMGGGLELALGCHFRVVAPRTQVALPEVKLGLLPGAGGTQRLPRLIGLEYALNMIVSGETVPSDQFRGTPLFDEFIEGDLLEGALAFAAQGDRREAAAEARARPQGAPPEARRVPAVGEELASARCRRIIRRR